MMATKRTQYLMVLLVLLVDTVAAQPSTDWPAFRGVGAKGVAEGFTVRTKWNADPEQGEVEGVKWEVSVPGLGHSSPVVFGDKVFVLTAISEDPEAPLQVVAGGSPKAADDNGNQRWVVLCYDKTTGQELWRKTAAEGKPKATRHAKATHANTSVCVDGENVLAFFGSEGLHCYDMEGNLRWSRDLGVINISKYGIGWGFASSPAIYKDRIAVVCDDPEHPYVAMLRLDNGEEVWRVPRNEVCERSWGTPLIYASDSPTQVIVNGWPWIVSYDYQTGEERWRLEGGGDNPIPTPFEANGWIYITNAHGSKSPIYVIDPKASGNLSEAEADDDTGSIVWSVERGGSYMSTPVVYDDYLYLGNSNGTVRCFHAKTGQKIYQQRLGKGAGVIASLVAADGKIFCAAENGIVYVLKPGPEFKILSENSMAEPCLATPAISASVIYIRTTKRLIAIQ